MERGDEALSCHVMTHPELSSPGMAVRRTASLPLAYDRATRHAVAPVVLRRLLEYRIIRFRG
jgi:hypothetical protein